MNTFASSDRAPALRDVMVILLLLQGSIALLTAAGGFFLQVVGAAFRGLLALASLELAVAVLLFALAAGALRSRGWADRWTARLEFLVLIGSLLTLDLRMGVSPTLAFAVGQVLLPLTLLTLSLGARSRLPR